MVLGMSNLLKMPIVIFSSMENYPVIPVLPTTQLNGTLPLYVCFNAAGCGHYDFVKMQPDAPESSKETIPDPDPAKSSNDSCLCGINKKGSTELQNVCNNSPGSYASRCKSLQARISCGQGCRCKGCCNPYGQWQKRMAAMECVPRKRQKFDYQATLHGNEEFLVEKGEKPRESTMTNQEFFTLEEVIAHLRAKGNEMSCENILEAYNYVQLMAEKEAKFTIRKKGLQDTKKALAAHDREANVMSALFKKQVEICYKR